MMLVSDCNYGFETQLIILRDTQGFWRFNARREGIHHESLHHGYPHHEYLYRYLEH